MPRIEHLSINGKKGEPNNRAQVVRFRAGHGIEGDAHAGKGHRQVSLLSNADVRALGLAEIKPGYVWAVRLSCLSPRSAKSYTRPRILCD
ncbi:hypothetical protein ACFL2V_19510 [Pseudomonadota bacterium]